MTVTTHPFNIGEIKCIAINDGNAPIEKFERLRNIFPSAPEAELRQAFEQASDKERQFCYNPLYIETGGQHVLIDTGDGLASENHGHLIDCLRAHTIQPEQIDIVFITHAHGDHINGLENLDGGLAFPNARYLMGKVEWQFWMEQATSPPFPAEYLEHGRSKLNLMKDNLTLVEPGDEIAPGVSAVEAYGHTPGHMAVLVESNGEGLLHIVDTAHSLLQVTHLDWSPGFDIQPNLSPVSRRRIFQQAADENLLTYAYHFPFPALGHFHVDGDGFTWQPIATS